MNEHEHERSALLCEQAVELVPRYQDGELGEDLAAPLRRHLLACPACRRAASADRNLRRWFAARPDDPLAVAPVGFAARVARLAFAGGRAPETAPEPTARAEAASVLPFVLALTAAAAALLLGLSVALALGGRPGAEPLMAEPSLHETLRELDALNAAEAVDDAGRDAAEDAAR